jgi:hypothetical protein
MRNSFIIISKAIRGLSVSKLFQLLQLFFTHPLFSFMGFWATMKAFAIAQKKFPTTASSNGIGNAFRHALWSSLILSYCAKISSVEKAKKYTLDMTNLHEELFPNSDLEKKMDLHNNQIGVNLFLQMLPGIHRQFFETSFLVEEISQKLNSAKIVEHLSDDFGVELVYLEA